MSDHHHPWLGMVKKVVLVGAMLASTQVLAHHNCGHHSYPEMWYHEVNWSAVHTFHHPTVDGAPLDFCFKDGKYCGRAAANQFCRMHGFRYSTQFEMDYHAGMTHSIRHMYQHHHHQHHHDRFGHPFHYIRCRA